MQSIPKTTNLFEVSAESSAQIRLSIAQVTKPRSNHPNVPWIRRRQLLRSRINVAIAKNPNDNRAIAG